MPTHSTATSAPAQPKMTEYVYVAPTKTRDGPVKTYHTDSTCYNLHEYVEYPARLATGDDWRECKICAGTMERGGGSKDIYRAAIEYND